MKSLFALLALFPAVAFASPFVVSDPSTDLRPTECGYHVDGGPRLSSPVAKDATGKPYCKIDMASISAGNHTITATFAYTDDVWGFQESAPSVPLAFSRPSPSVAPGPLRLAK